MERRYAAAIVLGIALGVLMLSIIIGVTFLATLGLRA